MSPTETLRSAADRLDEVANDAADAGPWRVGRHYGIHLYAGDVPVATTHTLADARLIAALGPDFAKQVVSLLRSVAKRHEWRGAPATDGMNFDWCYWCSSEVEFPCPDVRAALAVAEAVLRVSA